MNNDRKKRFPRTFVFPACHVRAPCGSPLYQYAQRRRATKQKTNEKGTKKYETKQFGTEFNARAGLAATFHDGDMG